MNEIDHDAAIAQVVTYANNVLGLDQDEKWPRQLLYVAALALRKIADPANYGEDGCWDADSYPPEIARAALEKKP